MITELVTNCTHDHEEVTQFFYSCILTLYKITIKTRTRDDCTKTLHKSSTFRPFSYLSKCLNQRHLPVRTRRVHGNLAAREPISSSHSWNNSHTSLACQSHCVLSVIIRRTQFLKLVFPWNRAWPFIQLERSWEICVILDGGLRVDFYPNFILWWSVLLMFIILCMAVHTIASSDGVTKRILGVVKRRNLIFCGRLP